MSLRAMTHYVAIAEDARSSPATYVDIHTPKGYCIAIMRRRPVSVIEFAAYRRRADELLTAGEQDAVVDLIAYDRLAAISFPARAACARFASGAAAAASAAEHG